MNPSQRGLLITFEGGEGAGKTTLIERLFADLSERGLPVVQTRAPGGTQIGTQLRELVLHSKGFPIDPRCELFLFLADRSQHVQEVILPALEAGSIVLCDRFNDSTLAYQSGARGFPEESVRDFCRFACQGLEPDLTFYLDLDPRIGFERAKRMKDRIEAETLAFHDAIRRSFQSLVAKEPKRCRLLDASQSAESVYLSAKGELDGLVLSHR
jgi:dTMP kinase